MKKAYLLLIILLAGCIKKETVDKAYGNFEVNEIIISAKASGELVDYIVNEGDVLSAGQKVGLIDTTILNIKKQRVFNKTIAMGTKIESAKLNLATLKRQESLLKLEKNRIDELILENATTIQTRDKIHTKYDVLVLKIKVARKEIEYRKQELNSIRNQLDEIKEKLEDAKLINPVNGTVLVNYKEKYELVNPGIPLYKIGNLQKMYLKIYLSSIQLDNIKIGQEVQVLVDKDKKENHKLTGKISWISSKSEFTPKNIQTKEERVDQAYAVKVLVENDGLVKIGMPGEIRF